MGGLTSHFIWYKAEILSAVIWDGQEAFEWAPHACGLRLQFSGRSLNAVGVKPSLKALWKAERARMAHVASAARRLAFTADKSDLLSSVRVRRICRNNPSYFRVAVLERSTSSRHPIRMMIVMTMYTSVHMRATGEADGAYTATPSAENFSGPPLSKKYFSGAGTGVLWFQINWFQTRVLNIGLGFQSRVWN